MAKQRCNNPYDCGTQFECVNGFCEESTACGAENGNNGCKPIDSRCLAPNDFESELYKPSENLPSCGIGDPNYQPDQKDCLYDCNLFCDEWSKISANLTPDTELKECNIDDACSPCRSCEIDPEVDDDLIEAIKEDYQQQLDALIGPDYNALVRLLNEFDSLSQDKQDIADQYEYDLEQLLIEQEAAREALLAAKNEDVNDLIEEEIALQEERANLDPESPTYEADLIRIDQELIAIQEDIQEREEQYLEDKAQQLVDQAEERTDLFETAQEKIDKATLRQTEINQEISELDYGAKGNVLIRQRNELENLETQYNNAKLPYEQANEAIEESNEELEEENEILDRQITDLQDRLAEIDTSTPEGQQAAAEIQTQINEREQQKNDNLDALQQNAEAKESNDENITNLTTNYEENKAAYEEFHQKELEAYDERYRYLQEERDDKIDNIRSGRGVCVDVPVPNRPCYCPPYIDENGKTVNDAKGRDCYLCNTENGSWQYSPKLCTVTCDRCVICDDGEEACATITEDLTNAQDLCLRAQRAAKRKCNDAGENPETCPYPKPSCEVEGPFTEAGFSQVVNESTYRWLTILQGGDASLPTNNMRTATVAVNVPNEDGRYVIGIDGNTSKINGKDAWFDSGAAIITVGDPSGEDKLEGKLTIDGDFFPGGTVTANAEKVRSVNTGNPDWAYRWFADGKFVLLPENDDGEICAVSSDTLEITEDMVGKVIQAGVRVLTPEDDPCIEEDADLYFKNEPDPTDNIVEEAPRDYSGITIYLVPDSEYKSYNAITVNYSELLERYPDVRPSFKWIDVGGSVRGAENFFYLLPIDENRAYYCQLDIINPNGQTDTLVTGISPVIGEGVLPAPPEDPCLEPDAAPDCISPEPPPEPTGNVVISPSEAEQGQVMTVDATINATYGISSDMYVQWYASEELLLGEVFNTLKLTQEHVGKIITCDVSQFDAYGRRMVFTSNLSAEVQNVFDEPTGNLWILGKAKLGNTLTALSTVECLDGFGLPEDDGEGGVIIPDVNYVWQGEFNNTLQSGPETELIITKEMGLYDQKIKVFQVWTDDFGVDREFASGFTYDAVQAPTQSLKLDGGEYSASPGQVFNVELFVEGTVEPGEIDPETNKPMPGITSIQWELYMIPDPSNGLFATFAGSEPAAPDPAVQDLWSGSDQECPENWDCFKSNQKGGETAPLGSEFFHKCPWPGYPELTYEESLESDCKKLCQDYCYRWSAEVPNGSPAPVPGDDTILLATYQLGSKIIYNFETCTEPPEEKNCPKQWKKNYVAVYRVQAQSFNYIECSCAEPRGRKGRVNADVEWSTTIPGVGPWNLDENERRYLPYCGDLLPGEFDPSIGCSPFEGVKFFDLDCQGDPLYGGTIACSSRGFLGAQKLRLENLCGSTFKWNPQRGFVVTDNEGSKSILYHGYTMWPFTYRPKRINVNTERVVWGRYFSGIGFAGYWFGTAGKKYDVPAMNPSQLPPRCVNAPSQVAFYDIQSNTFYSTLEIYKEIVGAEWYAEYGEQRQVCKSGVGLKNPPPVPDPEPEPEPGDPGYSGDSVGTTNDNNPNDPGPSYPEPPLGLGWVWGARFCEVEQGAKLYPEGLTTINPPAAPEREATPEFEKPIIYAPTTATWEPGNTRTVADLEFKVANFNKPPDAFRFTANMSATSPDNNFDITAGGRIMVRNPALGAGTYRLGVQANSGPVWSDNFVIVVTVV